MKVVGWCVFDSTGQPLRKTFNESAELTRNALLINRALGGYEVNEPYTIEPIYRKVSGIERDEIAKLVDGTIARELAEAKAEIERLKGALWGWSRGLLGQKGYTADEIKKNFKPYIETGDVEDLLPREARLLETIVELSADNLEKINLLRRAVEIALNFSADNDHAPDCDDLGALDKLRIDITAMLEKEG